VAAPDGCWLKEGDLKCIQEGCSGSHTYRGAEIAGSELGLQHSEQDC